MNEHETNEYLWSGTGPPDPEVQELERALAPLRYDGTMPDVPVARPRPIGMLAGAAAVLVLSLLGVGILFLRPAPPGWQAQATKGGATIQKSPMDPIDHFAVGHWLVTDPDSTVELRVADIGRVTVHGDTAVRLIASEANVEHRLELDHGKIDAEIIAPPRMFFVNTPAAVAVDLGCAYTLDVTKHGDGIIHVTAGRVALETTEVESIIPAEAICRLDGTRGPGTPYFEDTPDALREAVMDFDDGIDVEVALDVILHAARERDTLTLWHLLSRVDDNEQRRRVLDRLIDFTGLPEGITVEGIMALDERMLDGWWEFLDFPW
ncbi:MAG: FecR family protein [Planctomycetota bacterium]|jgi:hypothetical protein